MTPVLNVTITLLILNLFDNFWHSYTVGLHVTVTKLQQNTRLIQVRLPFPLRLMKQTPHTATTQERRFVLNIGGTTSGGAERACARPKAVLVVSTGGGRPLP